LVFGFKWGRGFLKFSPIINEPLSIKKFNFEIKKTGIYSIGLLGAGSHKDGKLPNMQLLKSEEEDEIFLIGDSQFKSNYYVNEKHGFEMFRFTAKESGEYNLEFLGDNDMCLKKTPNILVRFLSKEVPLEDVRLVVIPSLSSWKRITGFIFTAIGINAFLIGFFGFFGLMLNKILI